MSKRLTKRVLLIGWDAADWHIINPLIEAGKMPVLEKLIEHGVSGKIATLQPIISPILWNSIATGKHGDKHGILGFVEPIPGKEGIRSVNSTSRRAKALWNILSQNGMRSGIVNWYASHPAEPINGTIYTNRFVSISTEVPGHAPADRRSVHPPEALEAAEVFRTHPIDLSLQQAMAFFPKGVPADLADPRVDALLRILAECTTVQNLASHLAAKDDWDLLAVYYDAIDHAGHQFMEYHPPAMAHVGAEDAEIFGDVITGVYRFHDMMLGRLLDLVGPETTVILLSDHGFYSDHLRPFVKEHTSDPEAKISLERNPTSWHRPHGVFIAAGQPIKKDELIHGGTLLDVAPTILALLGLPVAKDMDGHVLTRIFKDPLAIETIDSYESPHPDDGVHREVSAEESDPWASHQALRQLAELGYINLPENGDVTRMVKDAEWDRRSNLAQIYFSTGRMEESLAVLRELLLEEERQHLRCRIAMCLIPLGRTDEAQEVIDGIRGKESGSPLPRLIQGQILLAKNRVEEGIAVLEPLLSEQLPLSHLHSILGQAYLRRGLLDKAETSFRKALERDGENAESHDGLGNVLREQGKFEDAVLEHMRSAALMHHRPLTHIHLGLALVRTGQIDWAIRAFEVATELSPDLAYPRRCLLHIYRSVKHDPAKAEEQFSHLKRLRKISPGDYQPRHDERRSR